MPELLPVDGPGEIYCILFFGSATLKKDGQKICLDPNAPWVKKVLERKRAE